MRETPFQITKLCLLTNFIGVFLWEQSNFYSDVNYLVLISVFDAFIMNCFLHQKWMKYRSDKFFIKNSTIPGLPTLKRGRGNSYNHVKVLDTIFSV